MLFWVVLAVLTAVASLSVLAPLYRARLRQAGEAAAAEAIYRDQLGELDRDLARGLIAESEAQAARTEIARRLIGAHNAAEPKAAAGEGRRRAVTFAAVAAIPIAALGLYIALGSPELPDRPLAARLSAPANQQDIPILVAKVEAHLAADPNDGRGWELLAPIYLNLGRGDDAVKAYGNAIRILGPTAEREANLGEAIVRSNGGAVTGEAQAAFDRAHALDAAAVRPRFYLALALGQQGKNPEAIAAWQDLLKDAPADAAWTGIARQALAQLEKTPLPAGTAASAPAGPSAADVAAAGKMTPDDRLAMINGMVGQLADRLRSDPSDADGWARLIRSYMVLERQDDARAALASARQALAGQADKLAIVESAARSVGLAD